MSKVSISRQRKALQVIAEFLGRGSNSVLPTGEDAARRGLGPMLISDWDWPSSGPTPTIILEGMEDWAIEASADEEVLSEMASLGIFAEPYAGYALCLYPA